MNTLQHIPLWVLPLLLGLIGMGLLQTRTRQMRPRRLWAVNAPLTLLSLAGVALLWRHTPWLVLGVLTWAGTCLLVTWVLGRRPAAPGAHYSPSTGRITVPGSWQPLALYLTLFACKFSVGFVSATAPASLHSAAAAIGISALYGLLSGLLNQRAWRLLQLKTKALP